MLGQGGFDSIVEMIELPKEFILPRFEISDEIKWREFWHRLVIPFGCAVSNDVGACFIEKYRSVTKN